jgi:hypothetical protein
MKTALLLIALLIGLNAISKRESPRPGRIHIHDVAPMPQPVTFYYDYASPDGTVTALELTAIHSSNRDL